MGGAKVVALDIGLAILAIVIAGVVEVRFRSRGSVHMFGVRALAVLGRQSFGRASWTACRGGYR